MSIDINEIYVDTQKCQSTFPQKTGRNDKHLDVEIFELELRLTNSKSTLTTRFLQHNSYFEHN